MIAHILLLAQQSAATLTVWDRILPYIIPSTLALIGVLVGHIILERKARREALVADEANDTNAFDVVTNKLMALVVKADQDIKEARAQSAKDIADLKAELTQVKAHLAEREQENSQLHHELSELHKQNAGIQRELGEVRRVNVGLGAYVGKLVKAWPIGIALPTPDDPIDFASIPNLYPRV